MGAGSRGLSYNALRFAFRPRCVQWIPKLLPLRLGRPCTTPVKAGEDPRAGRWRDSEKTECGIHFVNGLATRPYQEPTV